MIVKNKKSLFALILLTVLEAASCRAIAKVNDETAGDPADSGRIYAIREMTRSRAAHTATLLKDGRVLVVGGFAGEENSLASVEVFDPATKTFALAGNMISARAGHSATLLPNGKVLIAGGFGGSYLDSSELYDPKTSRFTYAARMTMPRSGHVATLLANGKVLFAGGVGTGWTFLADAEIYDPLTNTFSVTGSMLVPRESHTATLLNGGQVLITGGHKGRRSAITIYSSAEIYNPLSGTFTKTSDLIVKRHKHDAALLGDLRVLIVGGSDDRDSRGAYRAVEIYNPKTKTFAKTRDMNLSRYKLQGTTVLLQNGKILIAGGAAQAEIFNPMTNTFGIATGKFETMLLFATATLLQDGQVLIIGGYDENQSVSSRAWIYKS